jgi:rare lipoprotein A
MVIRAAAWHVTAVLLATLLAAGCSSTPRPARSGGFYQDDGPPDKAPADIARTPDAVPKIEPFHPYANRPYSALGRTYTPITDDRPLRQRGLASWYGRQFHGNRTASGERYDMLAMTAAHPTLPIPSYVRVTNTKNGASVVVRVNDRGPFKHGRVIDLSYAAAVKLGIAATGTGEVEVLRLTHADIRAGRTGMTGAARDDVAANAQPVAPSMVPPPPTPTMAAGHWSVQLGAFSVAANADALRARTSVLLAQNDNALAAEVSPRVERDGGLYRVLAGAFADRATAAQLASRLERALDRETTLYRR